MMPGRPVAYCEGADARVHAKPRNANPIRLARKSMLTGSTDGRISMK
jgi:hypothetical protein